MWFTGILVSDDRLYAADYWQLSLCLNLYSTEASLQI